MPRDSAGNYTLPAGNPVASGEIISANWANTTMEDLGDAISASLDRYGRGGMLAPFQFADGTSSAPGATWSNEPTTGLYRQSYANLRMAVTGQDNQRWTATSSYLWRNSRWEEIITDGGTVSFDDLTVTGDATINGGLTVDTNTLVVDNTNNRVGIGTATPDYNLHLFGANPIINMEHAAGGSSRIYFEDATDGVWGAIKANYGTAGAEKEIAISPNSEFGDPRFGGIAVKTATVTVGGEFQDTDLIIAKGGQVGIGATTPAAKLEVSRLGANWTGVAPAAATAIFAHPGGAAAGSGANLTLAANASSGSSIYFSSDTQNAAGAITYSHTDDYMRIRTGNSERVAITETGNVGIGTSTPGSFRLNAVTNGFFAARFASAGTSVGVDIATASGSGNIQYYDSGERLAFKTPGRMEYIVGDGTQPAYHRWINSDDPNTDANNEQMRLVANGSLGIGTTTPDANSRLHLAATTTNGLSGSGLLKLQNTVADSLSIVFDNPSNDWSMGTNSNADWNVFNITGNVIPLIINKAAPSNSMRIEADSLRIGANSSAPGSGNTTEGVAVQYNGRAFFSADSTGATLSTNRNSAGPVAFFNQSGNTIGRIDTDATSGILTLRSTAGSDLRLANNSNEGITVEASTGNVGIGTSTSLSGSEKVSIVQSTSSAALGLQVNTSSNRPFINFYGASGTDYGSIWADGTLGPTLQAPSDIRLKDNVTDHESELGNLMSLRPVRWDWKDENKGSGEGFIAQEVQDTAWADLVTEGDDGMLRLAGLGAVETRLIKALQEAVTRIESLEAEVAALKG